MNRGLEVSDEPPPPPPPPLPLPSLASPAPSISWSVSWMLAERPSGAGAARPSWIACASGWGLRRGTGSEGRGQRGGADADAHDDAA